MVIETPHGTLLRSEGARNFGILFLNGSTLRMQAAADVTKQPNQGAHAQRKILADGSTSSSVELYW